MTTYHHFRLWLTRLVCPKWATVMTLLEYHDLHEAATRNTRFRSWDDVGLQLDAMRTKRSLRRTIFGDKEKD